MTQTKERTKREDKRPRMKIEEEWDFILKARERHSELEDKKVEGEKAFNILLKYVEPEFRSAQRNKFIFGNEKDDNDQECSIMLLTAIEKFDPERGKSLKYYVRLICNGKLISLIQETKRQKNFTLNASQSLDMIVCHDSEGNECHLYDLIPSGDELLSDQLERRQYIGFLKKKLYDGLTPLEKDVLELHFLSYSYAEIASMLNLKDEKGEDDTKSVDNALQRAKNKIPKIMKDDIEEYEKNGGYNFDRKRPRTRKHKEVKI